MLQQKINYFFNPAKQADWLELTVESLNKYGIAVLDGVVDLDLCKSAVQLIPEIRQKIHAKFGSETLNERDDFAVNRLLMNFDPLFLKFIEHKEANQVVDQYISPKAILRGQISQTVLPFAEDPKDYIFYRFHQNFRHMKYSPRVDLESFVYLNDMSLDNGVIYFIPGSHLWTEYPSESEMEQLHQEPLLAKAGDYVFVDGMLWHKEHHNRTNEPTYMIGHQFVLPVVKPNIDYTRAIGEETMSGLSELLKQRLGWYNRIPTSLDEYYRPLDNLLYHAKLPSACP